MSDTALTDRLRVLTAPVAGRLRELVERRRVPPGLARPMLYALEGGKRLRPALCLAACELCGREASRALDAACAVEMVHVYSLVHDDLPAMDDDELRRGRPSTHAAFGEAAAILAGDALLTLAFEVLAEGPFPEAVRVALVRELAAAAGPEGMVAGQVLDLEGEGRREVSPEEVLAIHARKTMRLIRAAVRMGVLAAGGPEDALARLTAWAEKAGLAFQVADDVLDETATPEELGKSVGKDRRALKATAVRAWGLEEARRRARRLAEEAEEALAGLAGADFFRRVGRYFVERAG